MSEVETTVTVETVTEIQPEVVTEAISTVDTVTLFEPERIAEDMPLVEVLEVYGTELISETTESVHVITEGVQGPPGPPGPAGISEEDMPYAKRLDMVSETLMYKAEAVAGTLDAEPLWRIRRVTLTMVGALVDVREEWAGGAPDFAHVWADRATLTYS